MHCRAMDALGNLVDFCLMPGQAHDMRETDTLIRDLSAGHFLADRAFDADWLRNDLLTGSSQQSSTRKLANGGI